MEYRYYHKQKKRQGTGCKPLKNCVDMRLIRCRLSGDKRSEWDIASPNFSELTGEMLDEIEWELAHSSIIHSETGSLWVFINNYLILSFEECRTSY